MTDLSLITVSAVRRKQIVSLPAKVAPQDEWPSQQAAIHDHDVSPRYPWFSVVITVGGSAAGV
jgi:hypothetical protein